MFFEISILFVRTCGDDENDVLIFDFMSDETNTTINKFLNRRIVKIGYKQMIEPISSGYFVF